MNEYGDRAAPTFDIWFYAPGVEAGTGTAKASTANVGGMYNPDTKVTTWDTGVLQAKLGYIPAGP